MSSVQIYENYSNKSYTVTHELLCEAFYTACKYNQNTLALNILDETNGNCFDYVDYEGNTALIITILNSFYDLAELLLQYPLCNPNHYNNCSKNAFTYAFYAENESLVNRLLNYTEFIPLFKMCNKKWDKCFINALKILENKGRLKELENLHDDKTLLIKACNDGLEDIAESILNYPTYCNMSYVTQYKGTALTLACGNRWETIALKILQTPHLCNLSYSGNFGNALIIAASNKLSKVVHIISLAMNDSLDTDIKVLTDKYNYIRNFNSKYESELEKHNLKGSCLCCGTDNETYHKLTPCSHTINVCQECSPKFMQSNTCAVCKTRVNTYEKTYVVK